MPDTGAPWEIPFLDGTELVRAYPAFSEDLAEQIADGLSAAGNEGIGPNVVIARTTAAATITTSTYTDSLLEGTITPSSADSKILVFANDFITIAGTGNLRGLARILRGTTVIETIDRVYQSDGSGSGETIGMRHSFLAVDSPGTTSPVTYKTQYATSAGSLFVRPSSVGLMLLIEVEG